MTEVQKVSIGGYAFTLEVEAYAIVKQYLDELESYYSKREGGSEVMEGIEERMAELLYEKCADDGVASVAEVEEIIAVLGKPSAIESESDPEPAAEAPFVKTRKEKKKLYRDPTNKMIGGVCSGLAAYFKIDVVLIRIIFIGLFILGSVIGSHASWRMISINSNYGVFALLAYVALWIAMPEAKTVKQRWEMGVTNPPAGSSEPVGSDLGRVLRIFIGFMLMIVGVGGLTVGLGAMFGVNIFGWDIVKDVQIEIFDDAPSFKPLMDTFVYKLDLLLVYFLPMIGMIYGGTMMLFDFKSPSWRPGLWLFLLWVASLVVFIVLTCMSFFRAGWFS